MYIHVHVQYVHMCMYNVHVHVHVHMYHSSLPQPDHSLPVGGEEESSGEDSVPEQGEGQDPARRRQGQYLYMCL